MDKDLIRTLIRDVIAEEVKAMKGGKYPAPASATPAANVRIASDADLAAFARDVLRLAQDPKIRAAIEAGRHPFRLAAAAIGAAPQTPGTSHRIDKGVVTEGIVAKLGKDIARLVVGPGVSITPLARDKAKARNISVERIGQ